ncbi:hypothetical protein CAOG_03136 [Capsaspora owczarzaki ATCC 30864]|uniref:hypothetical protein n=1 Tax=Capsaspora owczarzaki (strain ATCC 30864) TaxID=595528 RepID=UPI0001FE63C9|nr:hypothetical protein CAOG_03136 [Capsaspora owczarzaki ATCC 30864]|eukprot:XP_004363975.1 hypothetical protein CAOG_03136 [Capsaspora owczarzaki ATCC 30864]
MVGFQQATQVMFSLKSFGRCIYAANRMFEGDVTFSSSPSFEHSDMSQPSSSGVPSQSYHRVVFGHWTSPLALRACHISFSRLVESVQATHNLLQEIPEYQERVPEEIRAYFAASVPALSVQTCLHNWTSELQLAQCVDTVAASDARLHAVIRNSVSARFESVTPGTRQSAFRVAYTAAELRTCLASSPGLIEAVGPSEAIGVQTVVRALFTLIKRRFHYAMLVSHVFGSDDDETAAAGDADAAAPRHPNAAAAPHHRRRGADGEAHDRPHGPRGWHFGEANNRQQHGAGADDQREEGPRHGPGHGRGHVGGRRHHGFVRFIVSLLSGEHGDLRRCAYAGQHFVAHLTTLLQCGDCLSELTQQIGDSPFMQAHPRKAQRFQTLAHLLGVSTLDEINVPEVAPCLFDFQSAVQVYKCVHNALGATPYQSEFQAIWTELDAENQHEPNNPQPDDDSDGSNGDDHWVNHPSGGPFWSRYPFNRIPKAGWIAIFVVAGLLVAVLTGLFVAIMYRSVRTPVTINKAAPSQYKWAILRWFNINNGAFAPLAPTECKSKHVLASLPVAVPENWAGLKKSSPATSAAPEDKQALLLAEADAV